MIGHLVLRTLVNVYGIVMLELTILRNDVSPAERPWTFGQVLAVFLLLNVVVEVFNMLLANIDPKEKENTDEESADNVQAPINHPGEAEIEMENLEPRRDTARSEGRTGSLDIRCVSNSGQV